MILQEMEGLQTERLKHYFFNHLFLEFSVKDGYYERKKFLHEVIC